MSKAVVKNMPGNFADGASQSARWPLPFAD